MLTRFLLGSLGFFLLLVGFSCSDRTLTPNGGSKKVSFQVIEGVQTLTVVGAAPKQALTLFSPEGKELGTLIADQYGQAHFAYVPTVPMTVETGDGHLPTNEGSTLRPGFGYRIRDLTAKPPMETGPLRVLSVADHPPESFYALQKLDAGVNYLRMRDGILLSAMIWFPDQVLCGPGPWPTVVEYSGYDPSNPDSPQPGSELANRLLCFVAVGVNMRGTGCSGGVFDVFHPNQHADGYDIIEIVARQSFVKHGKVGMVGLSYPGISQLYVAATRPPHLAAIAPLSVIEDPWRQAWPGGIYNSGFTRQWLAARDRYARPNGESWVEKRIRYMHDRTCEANQLLRAQNVNFEAFSRSLATFPADADERRLSNLVPNISVPVFLTGAWQDEQTGSRFATMLDDFTRAPIKRFTMFNGRHPDGYQPITLTRWAEFLEFYVARRIPFINPVLRLFQEPLLKAIFGAEQLRFELDRFIRYGNDFAAALRAYEQEPEVRILFENGFGSPVLEAPVARFEATFSAWPPPADPAVWYLNALGTLTSTPPTVFSPGDDGIDRYRHDPDAGSMSYILDDDLFHITWNWQPAPPGYALSYISEPFITDTVIIGNGGYANLWFASDATDANVEVSILEVRPDGTEFLVQTGVFAVKHRKGIDAKRSGEFLIEYTYAKESVEPLLPGEFVEVKVPIQPFAHAFRAGTRLRLVIDTPGRDHGYWQFENPLYSGPVIHRIARTPVMASYVKLPVRTDIDIPEPAPPCYSLRGIVCRPFFALPNTVITE